MRKLTVLLAVVVLLVCMLIPSASFTEDAATVQLARTIYALGRHESYETKLALGTVIMNRVENAWFDDTLGEVLDEQQQFPSGSRYDDDSLRAAHEVLYGKRVLKSDALYYQAADAAEQWDAADLVASVGNYNFYSWNGQL